MTEATAAPPPPRPRRVILLGSTGSIGTQAIDLVRRNPDRFEIVALAAGSNLELLAEQALELRVPVVAAASATPDQLAAAIRHAAEATQRGTQAGATTQASSAAYDPELLTGRDASSALAARPADVVVNGITGAIGLEPTLAALRAGTTLALANKESLIIGGPLVKALAKPGQIVPVDSEHSAIAQCLRGGRADEVRRLVITASGGPFRGRSRAELADVTPEQALAHPNFAMGRVITTNSATLVNKGLEVIEAHLLFDIPFERIDVVVHPQQMIHSMVEFVDGSTIAQ
ncbi:1-deoxy-D-xylulose-5-phosphate reductoisomerase, partial [Intrasporangium sp.]|uniref:1-deoxy-D-xylulose-5-phosphate reductoisomerase n=1 Tax=Intrasporangium sp. TaxID=1925024 RepID=UPI00293B5EA1